MAKKKNNIPAAAPAEAPEIKKETKKQPDTVQVIQAGDLLNEAKKIRTQSSTLSPDATVMALNGLKGMIHDNPNAAEYYGISNEAVQKLNKFTVAGFATVLALEVEQKKSPFAMKMLASQPEAVNAIAEFTGVSIDVKALPAPDKNGEVKVPSTAVKVTKEAKEKIKKEKEAAKNAVLDPTKIENDDMLKAALVAVLSDMKEPRPYDRIAKAVTFYNSVLEFQASKKENADAEIEKIRNTSFANTLRAIVDIAGPNVYSLDGICKLLRSTVMETESPISAFCLFRNASINPKTGKHVEDAVVADIVKILINWSSEACIAEEEKKISESNRISEKNKDNIGIVNAEKERREKYGEHIAYFKKAADIVNSASTDLADNFIEAYNDDKHAMYPVVRRAGRNIIDTYYRGKDITKVDSEVLVKNLAQHAGIITNLFRDPLGQRVDYSESNLVDMFPPEVPEKKPEEEKK